MLAAKSYSEALLLLIISSLTIATSVCGQPAAVKSFNKELSVTSVNDNYTPPFRDRYFTNGLSITFSRALSSRLFLKNIIPGESTKTIIRFKVAQQIYTPKNIIGSNLFEYDRPYAGYLFARTSIHTFWKREHSLQLSLTTGVIGPKAGGEKVQTWWHELTNLSRPEGWKNQISNAAVINLGLEYRRSGFSFHWVDVISTAGARAGTGFNNLYAGATVRTGNINALDHSAITASRLGGGPTTFDDENEWFLFLGFKNVFVFHNALIEGALFHPSKSIHTEQAEPNVTTIKTGMAVSTPAFTWMVTAYRLSAEVVGAESHTYASINMAVRF